MGFKVDASFLRFLTMGAMGVRATIEYLKETGFDPIELERYCASNKIWTTKVKRLRLPDLLCVRTGLRVEVRAKSDLKIRMSDAPDNPDRRWDGGLRDDDVVAFIACRGEANTVVPAGRPVLFQTRDMRLTVNQTKLGPPKSASEGAERDREWKSTVPSEDGEVLEVSTEKICTQLRSGRRQTYQLRGKHAYVRAGDTFNANTSMIAGIVPQTAPITAAAKRRWNPIQTLTAPDAVDRYASAKALAHRSDRLAEAQAALRAAMHPESDERVKLEMAASLAKLGTEDGLEFVASTVWNHDREDLRMEAVLILSEIGGPKAGCRLKRIVTDDMFKGNELRQAATWGLGKTGCRSFAELVEVLADEDDGVALHAIAAFDSNVPDHVVSTLVDLLKRGNNRARASASAALRIIGSGTVLKELIKAARHSGEHRPWVVATLGTLNARMVRTALVGDSLLTEVEPLLTLGADQNWLASVENSDNLRFLLLQNVST